eukprot:1741422-Rhodomonas_salina.1
MQALHPKSTSEQIDKDKSRSYLGKLKEERDYRVITTLLCIAQIRREWREPIQQLDTVNLQLPVELFSIPGSPTTGQWSEHSIVYNISVEPVPGPAAYVQRVVLSNT